VRPFILPWMRGRTVQAEEGRILLIEDNPSDIELIMHWFKKEGIAPLVHVLYDGSEALQYLHQTSPISLPEIVILDLKLPKISGLEVLKQMRSQEMTKKIPVVVFTSSNEVHDVEICQQFGMDLYIVKPVNHEEFKRSLGEVIQFWKSLSV
jgi:two-component system response regulator